MWRTVAGMVQENGGDLHYGWRVTRVNWHEGRVTSVHAVAESGEEREFPCDHLISTTSIKELIAGFNPPAPPKVREVTDGLMYRDFITVGLLVKKLRPSKYTLPDSPTNLVPDTWIYIQEPDVKIGRLQIFNNWSPAMVAQSDTVWLGLEYFCQEGDELWTMTDDTLGRLAISELAKIDLIDPADAQDFKVVRVPKAYPAYFGTYDRFQEIRDFVDPIPNLFLVGRNGMHRYNNQDHSMMTARIAVENILSGVSSKENIWTVNTEEEYHEEKS